MQWRTPRIASFSRPNCSSEMRQLNLTNGSIVIESSPSLFNKDTGLGAQNCFAAQPPLMNGLDFLVPPTRSTPVNAPNPGDTFTGRCATTEFFSKKKAYADPLQSEEDASGCAVPSREDLYVVRFINGQPDAMGSTIRVPLIYEVDQMSGLLAPLARIERSLLDDDFLTLDGWNVVNSVSKPNHWQVGGLDGQTSAYITASPGANDYVPGSAGNLSISHLYRDVYFPTDSPSGSVHLHMRILGNGSVAQPTDEAQDFGAVHLVPTSFMPQPDTGVGFENRLSGTMLINRISGTDYITEQLSLRTNVILGSLAGNTYRLVVSFHSGSGLAVQPYALALSRLMVVAAVEPPAQPPVRIPQCQQV